MRYLGLLLAVFGCYAQGNLYEVMTHHESLETLTVAIDEADLITILESKGPFTLFAPTNIAFAELPEAVLTNLLNPKNRKQLIKVLTYHLVPGNYTELEKEKSLNTVEGQPLIIRIEEGKLMVNNAIVGEELPASNGTIHLINKVLIPN